MKRILSDMLRGHRLRRERRLLVEAMSNTPRPVPPQDLRERLIAQTLAARSESSARPARSWAWAAWSASAALLAAVIFWAAWHGTAPRTQPLVRRPEVHGTQSPRKPPIAVLPEKHAPAPTPAPVQIARRPGIARAPAVRHQRREKPERSYAVAQAPVVESEVSDMRVTVSRTRQGDVGYAQASAWDTDDTGNPVKMQWTIVEDSHAKISRQELSVTDASGRRQSLTVTVAVASQNDSKGEQL